MKILKKLFVFILFLLVIVTIYLAFTTKKTDFLKYSNDKYGISFIYPKDYVLSEIDSPGSEMRKHHVITLIKEENLPPPVGGEGPVSINIDIYQNNLDNQTTEDWIRNTNDSNFKLSEGRLSSTTISDLPALSYRWSGLYNGTTIALASPSWIYAFSVTYLEMGEDIIQDFVSIKDSVKISN